MHLLPVVIATFSALAMMGIGYLVPYQKAQTVASKNHALQAQLDALKSKLQAQLATNTGTAATDSYQDPPNKIGLVNGLVLFTLPDGYKRQQVSGCRGGTIDSTAVCEDIAVIGGGDGTPAFQVAVYDNNSTDGIAQNWYEQVYDGTPLAGYLDPKAENISTAKIKGYSALSYLAVGSPDAKTPTYVNAFYTIMNGKYAVVVSAGLQSASNPAYDYRAHYLPILNTFVNTIQFVSEVQK